MAESRWQSLRATDWLRHLPLALAAVISAALVIRGTEFGLGLTPDGLTYIGVARNLADGQGLTGPVAQVVDAIPPADAAAAYGHTPLLRWPPLYPLVLGVLSWITRVDALGVARAFAVVFTLVNVVLMGAVVRRWTGSAILAAGVGLLIGIDPLFVHIHTLGASEPLFIAATLTCVLLADRWITEPRVGLLVAASVAAGAAWLTRFSGASVVGALFITVGLASTSSWRNRLRDLAIVTAGAVPAIGWLLHVELGPYAESHRAVRSLDPDKATSMVDNVAAWFLPSGRAEFSPTTGTASLFWIIALLGLVAAGSGARHLGRRGLLPALTAVFGLAIVVFTEVWVRPIPVTGRMLMPVQPLVVGLALTGILVGVAALARRLPERPVNPIAIAVLTLLLVINAGRQLEYVRRPVVAPAPPDAQVLDWLDGLGADVVVFSNDPAEVYGTYRRPAAALPSTAWQESGVTNEDYDQHLDDLTRLMHEGRAAVVLFSVGEFFNPTLPTSGFFAGEGFTVEQRGPVSVVPPGPPRP